MYSIDVSARDLESGGPERLSFRWEPMGHGFYRVHEDGHLSSAGFASSVGGAVDKAVLACSMVKLGVTFVTVSREERQCTELSFSVET